MKNAKFLIAVFCITIFVMLAAAASASQSIELKPGWNQISSPIAEGIDLATIESSCTILQYKNQKLWSWNAQAQSWTNPTKVEPLKGYWVYVAYVCTVPISGTPETYSTLQLYKGWNKISASGSLSAIAGTCAGHITSNWIWNWDKATERWIHPATMQLDKGYWIKVDTDCVMGASNPGDTVQSPAFSPAAGTYQSTQSITLSTTTTGATIRYTLDGTNPTETSTAYTSPISVSSTKTIKAGAWKSGMTPSGIASATYTISGGNGEGIATYIIYTDGAKVYAKKRTTGNIDYTGTLNQVLSSTVKSGNHIYIKNGAYSLSTITFPPNVMMECESNNAVIAVAADVYSIYLKSDSTIKGCTFDHKGKTKTIYVKDEVKNWRVENNYFINANIAVIVENLNTPVKKLVDIPNNFPTSGWGYILNNRGLHSKLATLEGTNKITVAGNYFADSNEDEFTDFNYNVHNVLFENNTFINHDGYSSGQEVIDMIGGNNYLTSYNIVRNNTIIGNFQTAIRPAKNNKHNIIENNYIEFKPGKVKNIAGIYFYGAGTDFSTPSDNKVINNRIVGAPIGIELSGANNNVVSGNKISNAIKGISLVKTSTSTYGSSVAPKNNLITKNTITNIDYGIYSVSSPGNTISDNTITGYRISAIYTSG